MVSISDIRSFINKIRGLIGNTDAVVIPKGEDSKDIIKAIYSSNVNKEGEVEITKFRGEFTKITIKKGDIGFISKDEGNKLIEKSADQSSQKAQPINLISENVGERYTKFKNEEKPLVSKVYTLLPKLNNKYKALISLSIQAESFYENGTDSEAETIKSEANKEWKDGSKFINLWASGYLKTIFDFISLPENITQEELNSLLDSFIKKSHSISFIHQFTDEGKVIGSINQLLKKKESYVAIHSLGSNNSKCKKIIKGSTPDVSPDYIQKDIKIKKRDVTGIGKIWYKDKEGLEIYKLIEPYL